MIQLEFMFTEKGRRQQDAITQQDFLYAHYEKYLVSIFGQPLLYKTFQKYELDNGTKLMQLYRTNHDFN